MPDVHAMTRKGQCSKLLRRWDGPYIVVSRSDDGLLYGLRNNKTGKQLKRLVHVNRGRGLEHTAPDCTQLGLRFCRTARRLMMTAHKQHIQMTEQVRTELQHIIDVLPTNVPANERR